MVGTALSSSSSSSSSSTSSSCPSIGSLLDDISVKSPTSTTTIKFLCSYGGKILPRFPDGKLRYVGGDTRVLAVDRSITFSELQVKLREMCGWSEVNVRCQLPTEDLDALVSVTSDEDLANLIEEYSLASSSAVDGGRSSAAARLLPLKIRAFLLPPTNSRSSPKSPTTPLSSGSGVRPQDFSNAGERSVRQISMLAATRFITSRYEKPAAAAGEVRIHGHGNHHHHQHHLNHVHHHRQHWQ